MAIKKFLTTFTIIIICFLAAAGVAFVQIINTAETRAAAAANEAIEKGIDIPGNGTTETGGFIDNFIIRPFNVMVFVKDKVGANTDAMMLVNVDTYNSKISVMSIPRDTIVSTDINKNGKDDDIMNMVYAAFGLDVNKTIEYIGNELGCKIRFGVVMPLKVFREVIDQLGGVDFDVPYLMDYDDPEQNLHIYFEPGMMHFNGEDAEKLLRFRKNNPGVDSAFVNGSDIPRIQMQQDFLKELVAQKTSLIYTMKLRNITNIIFDDLNTNATLAEIFGLIPEALKADLGAIEWFKLPVSDDENFIHLIPDAVEIDKIIKSNFQGTLN
ncbi:MAG: LCP family protein [Clostridia bacterium]|nr:LCP family protein [Clostridia bacterium]